MLIIESASLICFGGALKALIYVRTSSCEELAMSLSESCRIFCQKNHLEIKGSYFDVGVKAAAPRNSHSDLSDHHIRYK